MESLTIQPRCKADMEGTYISAEGLVYPCCWLGNYPWSKNYKEFHGQEHLSQLNILHQDLLMIISSEQFLKIERSWQNKPFEGCQHFCSQPIPQKTDGMDGTNDVCRFKLDAKTMNEK